jgi:hypothetical protein
MQERYLRTVIVLGAASINRGATGRLLVIATAGWGSVGVAVAAWNRTERTMPLVLVWTLPAVIAIGVTGHFLIALANLVDTALTLAIPTDIPMARRRKFSVMQGGKAPQTLLDK